MSRTAGQHRKPFGPPAAFSRDAARHRRKRLPGLLSARRAAIAALAIAAAVTALSVRSLLPAQNAHAQPGSAASHIRQPRHPRRVSAVVPPQTIAAGRPDLAIGARRSLPRKHRQRGPRAVYRNPLRAVSNLVAERVDMGADFGGAGPVFAIGRAVITHASGDNYGWPGGGWITYELTAGPGRGLQVYVAENVTPAVRVGEHVTSSTVIAHMYNGGDGIETGWAMPDGLSAESQLAIAGGISGGGPFPTEVGLNFDRLLRAVGVPAAPNSRQGGFGILPPFYRSSWASARPGR